jgi:peroxiredoxin Q/BCP
MTQSLTYRLFLVVCLVVLTNSPFILAVEVGDTAPDFVLQGSDGEIYELAQFIGSRPVVIAWFPKAFTGG